MSENNNIDILFVKFIENDLSKEEYKVFMAFFNDSSSRLYIEKLMAAHWETIPNLEELEEVENEEDLNKRFQKITARITRNDRGTLLIEKKIQKAHKRSMPVVKMAATLLILVGFLFYFSSDTLKIDLPELAPQRISPDAVTLTMDNGNVKVILAEGEQNITDPNGNVIGVQNGRQLNYKGVASPEKLVYNELTVPYGNQFDLALSDGTEIKLNAGSSLRYPVNFIAGQTRKVFLKGEAYFDVAKDLENPFVVSVDDIDVKVLGTEFNISFYPEDAEISTVLVEGSVKIYENSLEENQQHSILLKPGEKATWLTLDKSIVIEKVDVELYTAWKEGMLLFRKTAFNTIRKKLERHFDITIQNNYALLDTQVYTATFNDENIYEILDAFNQDTSFLYDYDITNNTLTLRQNQ